MSAQDTSQKLIAILGDTLLPYDTAEEIIADVRKEQPDAREKVLCYLNSKQRFFKRKLKLDKVLKEELQL